MHNALGTTEHNHICQKKNTNNYIKQQINKKKEKKGTLLNSKRIECTSPKSPYIPTNQNKIKSNRQEESYQRYFILKLLHINDFITITTRMFELNMTFFLQG